MRTIELVLACSALLWSSCSKDNTTIFEARSTDALWAMAPVHADVGVVVAPGTGETLLAAWSAVESSLAHQPAGARIRDAIRQALPPEVFDVQAHARLGIGLGRGAAMFMTPDDEPVVIVPLASREAFRNAQGGKAEDRKGATVDRFEKMRCKMIKDLYACASSDELLAQVGTSDTLAKTIAARPSHLRGDVEVHVDSRRLTELEDLPLTGYFREPGALQAALQLERGVVTARAYLPATPATPLIAAFVKVPDNLARSTVANKKPPSMGRLRVPLSELIPREAATAELDTVAKAVAGFDPGKDLLDNFTGEIIAYSLPTQDISAVVEIGLHQGQRLQALITTACSLAKLASLPVEITMKNDSCVATLDPAALKELGPSLASIPVTKPITLAVTATDKALVVHLGTVDAGAAPSPSVELEPLARDLMTESWNWAMWSRGIGVGGLDPALLEPLKQDPRGHQAAMLTLWLLGHVSEMGSGMAIRGDGIHAILHLGTQWANPDNVLQEFQKHLGDMLAGDTAAAERLEALAEKSPDTPLGRSYKAGPGGMAISAAGAGAIAAIAMLLFLKDQDQTTAAPETE